MGYKNIKARIKATALSAGLVTATLAPLAFGGSANAVSTEALVRFDRVKVSTATTGTVCFMPNTVGTESSVVVTFPSGYTVSSTLGNWTVTTTNLAWPTGATAWLGAGTATNVTGQAVTFPSSDLTVGTLYCFNWDTAAALTVSGSPTSSNAGTVATNLESSGFSTASIVDDSVIVTATVPQTFSLTLSGTTDALGTLSSGSVSSSPTPRTLTIGTNAKNGWNAWAKDTNTGLNSASAAKTIASITPGTLSTLSAGTEGYNTGVSSSHAAGTGSITVSVPFVNGAAAGGGLDTSLRTIAVSTGTASADVLTLTNHVAIAGSTPAATDYTDTITVVAAGLF